MSELSGLKGKVAIVTGAGRGIGRGIALRYANAGMSVTVASRTRSTVDGVVQEIRNGEGTALGVTCDVGHQQEIKAAIDQTMSAFGRIDVLVNSAQGFGTEDSPAKSPVVTPIEHFRNGEWEYTFRTGASATLWAMQAVFPHMKDRGGRIINFGSYQGVVSLPGTAAYNATKEAIRALTRTAAREWGKYGINVNCINPAMATDAVRAFEIQEPEHVARTLATIPLGRWGDPYLDCGGLALYLAAEESAYMTGMTLALDGGLSMSA